MHDRPVTDVAREIGVNRNTANGWIRQIPRKLAKDPQLQQYAQNARAQKIALRNRRVTKRVTPFGKFVPAHDRRW